MHKFKKKYLGTFGDFGTFSFFPGKNLGAFGDGGAIITNTRSLYEYCVRARGHGALKKYDHKFSGRNSRLDTIQSAVLRIKLRSYKKSIKLRNKLASIYFNKLKHLKQINTYKLKKNNTHSLHQFVIRTNKRNKLREYLSKFKIDLDALSKTSLERMLGPALKLCFFI